MRNQSEKFTTVAGEEKNPLEIEKKKRKEERAAELKRYQEDGQKMIDAYRRFFITFAKDVSLDFKMSDSFSIDLENGVVNLNTRWFMDKGFSKEQLLWANLHELCHFRDLAADPEKMMGNFDYIGGEARKTGAVMMKKWEDKYSAGDPEFVAKLKRPRPIGQKKQGQTMNAAELAAYEIHRVFYNIFDDIHVNNLVARYAPKYEERESGGEAVKKLYQEKLFPKTDYQKLPRHLQFLYQLLREEMVKDEPIVLSDEVQRVMSQRIKFHGREYTPKEIVSKFIQPKGGRDTKAGQRYFILQNTLEPIFEELLMKDLEDWDPQKPEEQTGKGGEGEPQEGGFVNPFNQDYDDFKQNNPDQIDEKNIKDWIEKHEEDKKNEEAKRVKAKEDENKTAAAKAEEAQGKMDESWCQKNQIELETLRQFRRIEAEVGPHLEELSMLWQRIIFGGTRKIERGMAGHFKIGAELDIPKVIEEWPQIEAGKLEEARVMKKMTQKERLIEKPELIRVRLLGDMSGSMDGEKIHVLQQCFVLILSSLREFNTYLNLARSKTRSELETDTEAWIFGDHAEKVKGLRRETGANDEQAEIVKIFARLQKTIGGTYDNRALQAIFSSLTPEDKEKIGQEKIMEIVFEITDGGSSAPDAARKEVGNLINSGVIARAFQIGAVAAGEREAFNEVWNKGREEKLGEIVGEKIDNLIPVITELLKKYLSRVRL